VYITAYGTTPTDTQCGVIEAYTGAKSLQFWSTYVNPASGTRRVAINGSSIATTEAASAFQAVTFTNGQGVVTAKYKDAGSLQIAMKDTTYHPDLPNGIRGGTGTFVSRPATFDVTAIQRTDNAAANPGATTAAGAVFLPAGRPFTATVTAYDAEGSTTPNFGRETPAESVRLAPNLVLPAAGTLGSVSASTGFASFTNGASTGTDFAYSEVGIVTLTPRIADGDYLGAGDVAGTTTGNVGRFIPNDFLVTANTPLFLTGCGAGNYTYIGQPFVYAVAPVLTATARAFGGSTTRNYTGAFFKMTNSTLTGRNYSAAAGTLDTSGLPATTTDPAIADLANGTATLTFGSGSGIAFNRTTPVAPFDASIVLGINVLDADGVAATTNPVSVGGAGGIGFTSGANQRYGRIAFRNAVGSELVNLPLPLRSEYYLNDTAGFVTHAADSCTTPVTLTAIGYGGQLNAGETCALDSGAPGTSGFGCGAAAAVASRFRVPPAAGDFNLTLAAPGAGNAGTVTLQATVPTWLKFDWNQSVAGTEFPTGIATFGVYNGKDTRIYERETY
jgi:MSHA biogenesis protein MshQ